MGWAGGGELENPLTKIELTSEGGCGKIFLFNFLSESHSIFPGFYRINLYDFYKLALYLNFRISDTNETRHTLQRNPSKGTIRGIFNWL